MSSSEASSSSSSPRTPPLLSDTAFVSYEMMSSPLLATIVEDEQVHGGNIGVPQEACVTNVKGRGRGPQQSSLKKSLKRASPSPQSLSEVRTSTSSRAPSPYPNSQFAALSDTGLNDSMSISNWLFERNAFTVGRIPVRSEKLAKKTGINEMVKVYDEMTAFTCARQCDVAKLQGANEADRRHKWDALLLNFFQPIPKQRDVSLERQLNLARNLAADDSSFATRAIEVVSRRKKILKSFMLVQDPKLDVLDTSMGETPRQIEMHISHRPTTSGRSLEVSSSRVSESEKSIKISYTIRSFIILMAIKQHRQKKQNFPKDLLLPVLLAKYKKRDESAISTSMNQMKTYLVSAVTFLSELGITDQPIFGLVVDGTLGAVTMAWKTNNQIYVMERNVRHYDIKDPFQKQLAIIDVKELQSKPWSKLPQRQEDERLAAARQRESEEAVAQDRR
ncbi:hypothetical protein BDR07DRAFT_1461189 [Suillus spraguei]|nr:hypothetical protein BDR07DRAFT_1461189 [Suillus spraguei]